jgi:hypothetical protein
MSLLYRQSLRQFLYEVTIQRKGGTKLLHFFQQVIEDHGSLSVLYHGGSPGGLGASSAAYYLVHGFILRNDVVFYKEYRAVFTRE